MYFDSNHRFNIIKNWSLDHPAEVQKIIDSDAELSTVVQADPTPSSLYLDPSTVVEAVQTNARNLSISGEPLAKSISAARTVIANNGVQVAREHIDQYLAQVQRPFDAAAKEYTKYLDEGTNLPEALEAWTADQLKAFQKVKAAGASIMSTLEWLKSLSILDNKASNYSDTFLVLDPNDATTYAEVQGAKPSLEVVAEAVKAGASLSMRTPAERDALCREYEQELSDAQAKRHKDTVGNSVGRLAW